MIRLAMKTVLTNGCFEILHAGHIHFLSRARQLGDKLIVALNSDRSVAQLKGRSKPFQPEQWRKMALEGLCFVDEVIIFDDLRVTKVLEQVKPDVWVKGGDYTIETLDPDERAMAERLGVSIVIIPVLYHVHTSWLVNQCNPTAEVIVGQNTYSTK